MTAYGLQENGSRFRENQPFIFNYRRIASSSVSLLRTLLLILFAGSLRAAAVETNGQTPQPYQVDYLAFTASEVIHLGSKIRLAVYGELGDQINESIKKDVPGTARRLDLYLDVVRMAGLPPPAIFSPEMQSANPEPKFILEFTLTRDSLNQANREAWDQLFSHIGIGEVDIPVGVGFNQGVVHLAPHQIKYSTRHMAVIISVIITGVLALLIGMFYIVQSSMLREAGPNSAFSLGKTQMAFWGLIVAISFVGVMIVSERMERIPPQVLVLIGISAATGLGSVFINGGQRNDARRHLPALHTELDSLRADENKAISEVAAAKAAGAVPVPPLLPDAQKKLDTIQTAIKTKQKEIEDADATSASKGSGKWLTDIVSDENGPSFHRLQTVLWTVILAGVFIWTVANTFSLPEFPDTLLLLLGLSNGTYLGFKFREA
jgi:hypothetical protein